MYIILEFLLFAFVLLWLNSNLSLKKINSDDTKNS